MLLASSICGRGTRKTAHRSDGFQGRHMKALVRHSFPPAVSVFVLISRTHAPCVLSIVLAKPAPW